MRTGKLAVAATGLVLATALLAGCGGDPIEAGTGGDGKPTASEKPRTPPSTPPSADRGLPGEEAKAVTTAAGKWIDASNKAAETLDPAPMLALSDASCENCNAIAKQYRKLKADGGKFTGDFLLKPQGVEAPKVKGDTATVVITVQKGAWNLVEKSDAKPRAFEPQTYELNFDLKKVDGKWIVAAEVPYTRK